MNLARNQTCPKMFGIIVPISFLLLQSFVLLAVIVGVVKIGGVSLESYRFSNAITIRFYLERVVIFSIYAFPSILFMLLLYLRSLSSGVQFFFSILISIVTIFSYMSFHL